MVALSGNFLNLANQQNKKWMGGKRCQVSVGKARCAPSRRWKQYWTRQGGPACGTHTGADPGGGLALCGLARADDAALVREANSALAQKDYPTAFSIFSELARHGDAQAQHNVGAFYYSGMGVQRDEKQAFEWFTRFAQQGNDRAMQFIKGMSGKGNPYAQDAYAGLAQANSASASAPVAPPQRQQGQKVRKSASGLELGAALGQTGRLKGISNSTSYSLLAGYRFDDRWSVALAYSGLYHRANADGYTAANYPGQTGTFDLSAASLAGQYAWRLNEQWSLLGDLGFHHSTFTVNGTGSALKTGSASGLVAGLKAQYDLSASSSLRGGFDSYLEHGGINGTLTRWDVGVIFRF